MVLLEVVVDGLGFQFCSGNSGIVARDGNSATLSRLGYSQMLQFSTATKVVALGLRVFVQQIVM